MFFNNWLFLATIGKLIIIEDAINIEIINFNLNNEKKFLYINF